MDDRGLAKILPELSTRGESTTLKPFLTFRDPDDFEDLTAKLTVTTVTWPKPQNGVIAASVEQTFSSSAPDRAFLLVRPGEQLKVEALAELTPSGFREDGRYTMHLEWIAIPLAFSPALDCGTRPVLADPGFKVIDCADKAVAPSPCRAAIAPNTDCPGSPSDRYPIVRQLDADSRMITANYWQIMSAIGITALAFMFVAK